jgi:hypothetical protein
MIIYKQRAQPRQVAQRQQSDGNGDQCDYEPVSGPQQHDQQAAERDQVAE